MAFTNVYDVTYPPATQLVSSGPADFQAAALNVQQRMAAISGLDASKPNFAGDAQPANWDGILFFATDTGQIYQFNNPSWTNITTNILGAAAHPVYKTAINTTITGTTLLQTLVTINVPGSAISTTSFFRVSLPGNIQFTASGGGTVSIICSFGGFNVIDFFPSASSQWANTVFWGGNLNSTSSQMFIAQYFLGTVYTVAGVQTSAVATGTGVQILLTVQNPTNASSTLVEGIMLVEVFT
jgi:hypothetical protein